MRVLFRHDISKFKPLSKQLRTFSDWARRKCTRLAVFWLQWPWGFFFHLQCLPFPQHRRRIPYLWTERHHLCGRMFTPETSFSILAYAIGYRAQACPFLCFKSLLLTLHDLFRKWQVLIPILIIMIFFTMLREYGDLFDASLFEPIN